MVIYRHKNMAMCLMPDGGSLFPSLQKHVIYCLYQ